MLTSGTFWLSDEEAASVVTHREARPGVARVLRHSGATLATPRALGTLRALEYMAASRDDSQSRESCAKEEGGGSEKEADENSLVS